VSERHAFATSLLSRIEDAGLNASAPPQQVWLDGWLVRFSPGKAKRSRCINAVASGRLPLVARMEHCERIYRDAGLPLFVRITPFTRPATLDDWLAGRGFHRVDETRVMVATEIPEQPEAIDSAYSLERLSHDDFAEQVGTMRASPVGQRAAHAERLAQSPVPYQGWVLRTRDDGTIVVCGQMATDAELVGLYDVFTHPDHRGQGLARRLCALLLARARAQGARVAYLQVDAANLPARAIYRRLGFVDAYAYHYRAADPEAN
jgi:GNAT superfamily N-acetyltransferase